MIEIENPEGVRAVASKLRTRWPDFDENPGRARWHNPKMRLWSENEEKNLADSSEIVPNSKSKSEQDRKEDLRWQKSQQCPNLSTSGDSLRPTHTVEEDLENLILLLNGLKIDLPEAAKAFGDKPVEKPRSERIVGDLGPSQVQPFSESHFTPSETINLRDFSPLSTEAATCISQFCGAMSHLFIQLKKSLFSPGAVMLPMYWEDLTIAIDFISDGIHPLIERGNRQEDPFTRNRRKSAVEPAVTIKNPWTQDYQTHFRNYHEKVNSSLLKPFGEKMVKHPRDPDDWTTCNTHPKPIKKSSKE